MATAIVVLVGPSGNGTVRFTQASEHDPVAVHAEVHGLSAGLHGFHIHAFGDTTNGCTSTGPHFNPANKAHGAPEDEDRHVGDLGNITVGDDGVGRLDITDRQLSLFGAHSIVGRAVVVHADPDDLGKGGFEDSKTTGHAGARILCGVIGLAPN